MAVSYKKLWKLLIDKDMKKKELEEQAKVSHYTVSKMYRGENVTIDILERICKTLNCSLDDIVEFVPDLFVPSTIDDCYDKTIGRNTPVPGIKEKGEWATNGHPQRVVRVDKNILKTLSAAIGGADNYEGIPLPLIHSKEIYQVLERFAQYNQQTTTEIKVVLVAVNYRFTNY